MPEDENNDEVEVVEVLARSTDVDIPEGTSTFMTALLRSNANIKKARADSIGMQLKTRFRRKVEDIHQKIREMKLEKDNMLDLSPDTAISLKVASDFDAESWSTDYLNFGVKIREEEIRLGIAMDQYTFLFGVELDLEQ